MVYKLKNGVQILVLLIRSKSCVIKPINQTVIDDLLEDCLCFQRLNLILLCNKKHRNATTTTRANVIPLFVSAKNSVRSG